MNREKSPDEIEYHIRNRSQKAMGASPAEQKRAKKKVHRAIGQHWKEGLYRREYRSLTDNNIIATPSDIEFTEIYHRMHKFEEADHLNCGACGYGACRSMAIAIHNGLNHPGNCFHYERKSRSEMTEMLFKRIRKSTEELTEVLQQISGNQGQSSQDFVSMQDIAEISRSMRVSVQEGLEFIQTTISTMDSIRTSNEATSSRMQILAEQIQSIWDIVGMISAIADQTKIIAFNAELEASSAGETGRSFEIVAAEIRRLADSTVSSTASIKEKIQQIQTSSQQLTKTAKQESESINKGANVAGDLQEVFGKLSDFSKETDKKISLSIDSQIGVFQHTLDELADIVKELDTFGKHI